MSKYEIQDGDTITDVVLNSTAALENWEVILDANGFDDWTPPLLPGDFAIIPDTVFINIDALQELISRPISNRTVPNIYDQIDAIFDILATAPAVDVPVLVPAVKDPNKTYTVQDGDSISDVVINATGTLANLDIILTGNNFEDWTPVLLAGEKILIPDTVTQDPNAARQFVDYPISNASVSNVDEQISNIFELLNDNWILTTGFWNDLALWKDQKTWID